MDWFSEAAGSLGRLWLRLLDRLWVWVRGSIGLNKQRPSPLKEMKVWRT